METKELRKELIDFREYLQKYCGKYPFPKIVIDNYIHQKLIQQVSLLNPEIPKPVCYHPQEDRTAVQGRVYCMRCKNFVQS